ncbi:hypothetical protein HW49_10240 [Porphyromonadaceae bacterium COT-184 OH4590]|nr:hypothetical protein HW49_10240 [Porphyromonadaceae bacterium COT-184 OH4590]
MRRTELNEFDIKLEGQVEVFFLNSEKYKGIVYEILDGKVVSEFEVVEGLKNGYERIFFQNGIIESESFYKKGLLDGLTKNYCITGELQEEAFFEFGICLWYKLYDEKGYIKEKFDIDKNSSDYKLLEAFRKYETD